MKEWGGEKIPKVDKIWHCRERSYFIMNFNQIFFSVMEPLSKLMLITDDNSVLQAIKDF